MDAASIDLDKVSVEIDSILGDIKSFYNDDALNNINVPSERVNYIDVEKACKIFGCGADK